MLIVKTHHTLDVDGSTSSETPTTNHAALLRSIWKEICWENFTSRRAMLQQKGNSHAETQGPSDIL